MSTEGIKNTIPKYFSKARVGNVTAAFTIISTMSLWMYMVVKLLSGDLVLTVTDAGNIIISPVTVLVMTVLGFMNGLSGFAAKHLWDSASDNL